MTTAYLSLGSNLGDKKENLQTAVDLLRERKNLKTEKISGIYITEPVGFKYQDDFYNIAVKISFEGTPQNLIDICMDIEKDMQKENSFKWGPRNIDIDIISFGNEIINSEKLKLPHPEYKNRKFVLVPLSEIAPDYVCPEMKLGIKDIINNCKDKSRVNRLKSELV